MPENRYLNPEGVAKPKGSFTHGAEYPPGSRVLYTAGQVGTAPDGTVPGDFFEQVDNIWRNLGRILEFNEMTADDIIKVNHFLTDAEHVWPYDEHVRKYLGKTLPASTLVVIAGLVRPECLLEVEVIAAAPQQAGAQSNAANRYFNPDGVSPPGGLCSHGAEFSADARVLHTAGQVGALADRSIPDDFAEQAENTWRNLKGVLEADGMAMADIVKLNVFFSGVDGLDGYRDIHIKYMGDARPASTALFLDALAYPEFKLEVEIVAAKL